MDTYVENCSLFTISTWFIRPVSTLIGCIRGFVRANPDLFVYGVYEMLDEIECGTIPVDSLSSQYYIFTGGLAVLSHLWIMIIKSGRIDILDDYGIYSIILNNPEYIEVLGVKLCKKYVIEYFDDILSHHFANEKYKALKIPMKILAKIKMKTQDLRKHLDEVVNFRKSMSARDIFADCLEMHKLCSDYTP